ncbi:YadA family autotransporter adhesin [Paludibacterium paludis]|uniref:Trimeric autotransporter adhesin YadA-like C-terminal membrane anchor domain-containing protein n=1 Tax=Paludibacterium paludis TaxID=1225769 RepID=A0A918NZR0_9NEIS|nr:YadA-like family protein [Paludibacterium paludis]GGY06907.1 hypothetical protein GCM10011289_06840 [Paludibacterium paludis]
MLFLSKRARIQFALLTLCLSPIPLSASGSSSPQEQRIGVLESQVDAIIKIQKWQGCPTPLCSSTVAQTRHDLRAHTEASGKRFLELNNRLDTAESAQQSLRDNTMRHMALAPGGEDAPLPVASAPGSVAIGTGSVADSPDTAAFGNRRLVRVAAGRAPGDAVNVAQLGAVRSRLEQRIADVDSRARKGIALTVAMAALKPHPGSAKQHQVALGVGQYRDRQGLALGYFHVPNDRFMMHAGLAVSGSTDQAAAALGAVWSW